MNMFNKFYNLLLCMCPEFQQLKREYQRVLVDNQRLEKEAHTDFLTGLYNRRYTLERLETEIYRSARYQEPLSLMIIDVDFFKKVNDTYGHTVGDMVLKMVSTELNESIREIDLLGRYGGEEFVVVCPNTDILGVAILAERIRAHIEQSICEITSGQIKVTVSIGTGTTVPEQMITDSSVPMQNLIDMADSCVYEAKESGRNCIKSKGGEG